ncbi:MAG: hypothetical protein MZV63_45645 [Marinilabiliales bacterium]|nr:hypothetical protein [Marinilabiliales bacterium]
MEKLRERLIREELQIITPFFRKNIVQDESARSAFARGICSDLSQYAQR